MESKWYVVIETAPDGRDYVGINDDSYTGDGIISEHNSEDEADQACIKYAQEQGLPLFADYQEGREVEKHFACPQCGNRDMDTLLMDEQDLAHCQKCGTVYNPLDTDYREVKENDNQN